jgi:hypothetical protein
MYKQLLKKTDIYQPLKHGTNYTGRFIMHSGITKIYYRNTVGLVFTKVVQLEATTQEFISPLICFSS